MPEKETSRCQRCGRRLKKGGNNYRLECSVMADFDGYIDAAAAKTPAEKIVEEIETSGMTEQELEEQVYFVLKQKLCSNCRDEIVEFLKGSDWHER